MAYIERNTYLDRLWRNKDMDTIKVFQACAEVVSPRC